MLFQVDLPITRLTRQLKPLIIALSDRSEAIVNGKWFGQRNSASC